MRRAKLYYLRGRIGKRARVRERRSAGPEIAVERELLYGPDEAVDASGATAEEAVEQDGPVEEVAPDEAAQDAAPQAAAEATDSAPESADADASDGEETV